MVVHVSLSWYYQSLAIIFPNVQNNWRKEERFVPCPICHIKWKLRAFCSDTSNTQNIVNTVTVTYTEKYMCAHTRIHTHAGINIVIKRGGQKMVLEEIKYGTCLQVGVSFTHFRITLWLMVKNLVVLPSAICEHLLVKYKTFPGEEKKSKQVVAKGKVLQKVAKECFKQCHYHKRLKPWRFQRMVKCSRQCHYPKNVSG